MTTSERTQLNKMKGYDKVFLCAIRAGVDPLTAFRESSPERANKTLADMQRVARRLIWKYPDICGPLLEGKDARKETLEKLTYMAIRSQLHSENWKEKDCGVKNARALTGIDAPTKSQHLIESPHLDTRPLVPASERFAVEN